MQFWAQIVDLLNTKMDIHIENEPQTLLFHSFPPHANFPVVLHIILMAAKRSLLSKWLVPILPSMSEVVAQVKHYLAMDKLETIRFKNTHTKSFFFFYGSLLFKHF